MTQHHWPSWAVAFSPSGDTLAAGGVSSVRVFDTASGAERAEFELSKGLFCRAAAFSPDGKTLAASVGRNIMMFDIAQRKTLAHLEGHGSDVVQLTFAKDELFSVSCGQGIKSWTAKGEPSTSSAPARITRLAEQLPDNAQSLNDEAWFVLEAARGSAAQYADALRQAQIARRLAPDSTNCLQTLGAAFYRTGRYADAIESLRQIDAVKEAGYMIPPAWFYLALAYHKNGDEKEARQALARVRLSLRDDRDSAAPLLHEVELEFFGPEAREAQDRVDALFDQGLTNKAVLAAIETDSTLKSSVRAAAQKLAPYIEAERWVQDTRGRVLLRTRILRQLSEEGALSDAARPLAEAMANKLRESPSDLNEASWKIVSQPGLPAEAYTLALEQIEEAMRLREEAGFVNTLGVAQYRAGRYKEALETLKQSQQRNSSGPNTAEDLAFIALAQHQLGQTEEARQTLKQLRENKSVLRGEAQRFLSEAETVIEGKTPGS
jgi:tetratricopeptide (TPR) repeat protein